MKLGKKRRESSKIISLRAQTKAVFIKKLVWASLGACPTTMRCDTAVRRGLVSETKRSFYLQILFSFGPKRKGLFAYATLRSMSIYVDSYICIYYIPVYLIYMYIDKYMYVCSYTNVYVFICI